MRSGSVCPPLRLQASLYPCLSPERWQRASTAAVRLRGEDTGGGPCGNPPRVRRRAVRARSGATAANDGATARSTRCGSWPSRTRVGRGVQDRGSEPCRGGRDGRQGVVGVRDQGPLRPLRGHHVGPRSAGTRWSWHRPSGSPGRGGRTAWAPRLTLVGACAPRLTPGDRRPRSRSILASSSSTALTLRRCSWSTGRPHRAEVSHGLGASTNGMPSLRTCPTPPTPPFDADELVWPGSSVPEPQLGPSPYCCDRPSLRAVAANPPSSRVPRRPPPCRYSCRAACLVAD